MLTIPIALFNYDQLFFLSLIIINKKQYIEVLTLGELENHAVVKSPGFYVACPMEQNV